MLQNPIQIILIIIIIIYANRRTPDAISSAPEPTGLPTHRYTGKTNQCPHFHNTNTQVAASQKSLRFKYQDTLSCQILTQPNCPTLYGCIKADNRKFLSSFPNRSKSSFLVLPLMYSSANRKGPEGRAVLLHYTVLSSIFSSRRRFWIVGASQQQSHESFDTEGRKLVAIRLNLDESEAYKVELTPGICCTKAIFYMMGTWKKKTVKTFTGIALSS